MPLGSASSVFPKAMKPVGRFELAFLLPTGILGLQLFSEGCKLPENCTAHGRLWRYIMTANQNNKQQNYSKPITDDAILKVAKEVVVKFIESGRLSPDNFSKTFHDVFTSIKETAGQS